MARTMHPKFARSFADTLHVPVDFQEALWVYMAYGLDPGGFGMCVLHNDFCGAVLRAHPLLSNNAFKDIARWLSTNAPTQSYGGESQVKRWVSLSDDDRCGIMIECGLRPSVMDILRGEAIS